MQQIKYKIKYSKTMLISKNYYRNKRFFLVCFFITKSPEVMIQSVGINYPLRFRGQ